MEEYDSSPDSFNEKITGYKRRSNSFFIKPITHSNLWILSARDNIDKSEVLRLKANHWRQR
jgi:hypothetical protein